MSDKVRKSRNGRWAFRLVGLGLILLGCFIRAWDPYPVRMTRLIYFDVLQRLSPREFNPELPVRVVDIDEASLASFGQWPWPRTLVAQLVQNLGDYGAATIAFDMLFAEPDRYSPSRLLNDPSLAGVLTVERHAEKLDNDVLLGMEMAYWPVVLGVAARLSAKGEPIAAKAGIIEFGESPAEGLISVPHWTPIAPPLDRAAAGVGGVNVSPIGGTGIVRRAPVLWNGPDGPLPSLAVEALRVALGETSIFVEGAPDEAGIMLAVEIAGYRLPTTENGELWLKYRRDSPDLYISAKDVLEGTEDPGLRSEIEGRIILIGTSAAGLFDIHQTALGESVPGVSIHAQMIEQTLTGEMLSRSDITAAQELLAFAFLGLVVIAVMSSFGAIASFIAGGIAAAAVLAISWLVFQNQSILFDATFPLIGGIANFGLLAGYLFVSTEREKRQIRKVFSHYVAPEILDEMENSGHQLQLGGESQEITVMFSDIRGFTALSESASATELVSLLNALFSKLGDQILHERGTIDKFIGDAIMAFWNAPLPVADHPCRAGLAALRMRRALAQFNASEIMRNRKPIALATGVATGQACVGNIGSQKRFNYTVIGDVVNVSARIEQCCRTVEYDIVVSDAAYKAGRDDLAFLQAGQVDLKGKANPEPVFVLVGDSALRKTDAFQELVARHGKLIAALRTRKPQGDIVRMCQHCEELAADIEPGLRQFYRALAGRAADFRAASSSGPVMFTRNTRIAGGV